jgi:hypothetical protein
MHVTLQATDRTLTLDLSETVRLLDARTIEVDCPHFLEGGRMPVEAWQVLDLYQIGGAAGLAEIGVTVLEVNHEIDAGCA